MYIRSDLMLALRTGDIAKFINKNPDIEESVITQPLGKVNLPTGKIVACDPLIANEAAFKKTVPPGEYPVMLYILNSDSDKRVAFAEIRFNENMPTKYELATIEGDDLSRLGNDDFFGYGVDTGTGSFMDEVTCEELKKIIYTSDDYSYDALENALETSYVDTYETANVCLPDSDHNVVAFSSGWGDGTYPTFWGFDANGDTCCIITDFITLDDDDD